MAFLGEDGDVGVCEQGTVVDLRRASIAGKHLVQGDNTRLSIDR